MLFFWGFIWILKPRWGDEMVLSVWSTARVSEARWFLTSGISRLQTTIFIMKRNDWSMNSNLHAEWRYTFFFWTFWYRILYCQPQSASHAFQQWDNFLLDVSRLKHYFHYESYIDKPRTWWRWVRKDGTHFFAGHLDTQTESRVQPDRKGESSSRRTLIVRPNSNNTSKKDWNCLRLRRAEHLSPQYPTLSDIIWLSLSNSYHTKP